MDPEALKMIPLWIIAFLIAASVHECAHAFAAFKLGDDTAEKMGRLTLNPIPHIDPVGLIFLVISAAMGMGFGWAKPVPVNPYNLRSPKRDMMIISVAGPVSNVIMAAITTGVFWLMANNIPPESPAFKMLQFVYIFGFLNVILAAFNMIPMGPLDGAKVVAGFMPDELADRWMNFNYRYGMIVFFVLMFSGLLRIVLMPLVMVVSYISGFFTILNLG